MGQDRHDFQEDFGLAPGESFEPAAESAANVDRSTPHVMTVLGPVDPDDLGPTLVHEHLLANPAAVAETDPDLVIPDRDAALADVEAFSYAGGGAIVDATPPDNGRDLAGLRWVAERVAAHVVATAGFHKHLFCAPRVSGRDAGELAEGLTRELAEGAEGHVVPGLLKAGSSLDEITPEERTAFAAVALAHCDSGVPITTHTEAGTMALEQVELLARADVDPRRVIIGHIDRRMDDRSYLLDVLKTGAFIGFDQIGKPAHGPDERRARVLAELIEAGWIDQLLVSQDLARKSLRPAYGGQPGWTYMLDRFTLLLMEAGVEASAIRTLLVANPARALTILPLPGGFGSYTGANDG